MKVILHIGGSKCGSSAIQAYLRQNVSALADQGVAVPGKEMDFQSTVSGEQIWFFENAAGQKDIARIVAQVRAMLEQAKQDNKNAVIISAENICNHSFLAPALKQAISDTAAQVVFYVRRQDDFLISGWQQWHLKHFDSISAYLADRVGRVGNWHQMIVPWADAFGDECISVRPFVRHHLKSGDVVADFFDLIGVSQDTLSPLNRVANPSFDEALGRIAHRVKDVFDDQHDNTFYEVMIRLLGASALKTESASSLLGLDTRRHILARYAEENEALKQRFLPQLGKQPLFCALEDTDVSNKSETDLLSEEMAMLTRAIYALAVRSEAQQTR